MSFIVTFFRSAKSVIVGLGVTIKELFRPTVTIKYPMEKLDLPVGFRGIPVLLSDPEGQLKCICCELCAKACPVQCITIESHRGEDKKKVLDVYNLDATWCMFCGICAEVCPADALAVTDVYELSNVDLHNLLFDKERLAAIGRNQATSTVNYGVKIGGEPTR